MEAYKTISIKLVGGNKPIETRRIEPGATARDVIASLGLEAAGYQLSDSAGTQVFRPEDNLYALCTEGQLLMCSALVDAGGLKWVA